MQNNNDDKNDEPLLPFKDFQAVIRILSLDEETEDSEKCLLLNKLLAYFSQNREKLRDPEFQQFFKIILFHDHWLKKNLQYNPSFAFHLYEFCKANYQQSIQDVPTALYFLNLARYLQEHIVNAIDGNKLPQREKIDFLNYNLELATLAKKSPMLPSHHRLIHREIIASYISNKATIDEKELLKIWTSHLQFKAASLDSTGRDPCVEDEASAVIAQGLPKLAHFLTIHGVGQNSQGELFLNQLAQAVNPQLKY